MTAIILDTFTAPDGTDPTSRDLDVFPAITGANRWRWFDDSSLIVTETFYPSRPGRIESNRLALWPFATYTEGPYAPSTDYVPYTHLELHGDANESLVSGLPFFMLLNSDPGSTGAGGAQLEFDSVAPVVEFVYLNLNADGSYSAQVAGAGGSSWSSTGGPLSPGSHIMGIYIAADGALSLIADGSVIETAGAVGNVVDLSLVKLDLQPTATPPGSVDDGTTMSTVGAYESITLDEAITLTAPPPPSPPPPPPSPMPTLSVPQAIFAALRSLVNDRVYPNAFPQGDPLPVWPAVRYTIVSTDPAPTMCGSDGEDVDDVTVFIDAVAVTYPQMRALKAQVIAALEDTDPPCVRQIGGTETFDGETRTNRAILTYLFQQSSAP